MITTNSQKLKALQKYFGKASSGGDEVAFCCPSCKETRQEKKKLIVRLVDGWYHCWVCGLSGKSFYTLLRKMAPQALQDPAIESFVEKHNDAMLVHEEEKNHEVTLPKDLFLVGLEDTSDPDICAVHRYLENRGLTKNDMLRWRIAATKSGLLKRKAIIPSFDEKGELNYYVARSIDDSKFKYKNSTRPKNEIIFNEIDIDWKKPIVLVEGVFDAIMCPENTIPVLGSDLSRDSTLFRKLWENGCQVTVAFDPDLKEKSHKVCKQLANAGLEVMQVWAPDGKDFGSMSKKDVKNVLQSARTWSKEERLFFKIRNITSGSMF